MTRDIIRATANGARRHSVALLDQLFPPPRLFAVRLWDGTYLPPGNAAPSFTLVLNHTGTLRRMFAPPVNRSLVKTFIAGDFEIEGGIFAAVTLFDSLAVCRLGPGDLAALMHTFLSLPSSDTQFLGGEPVQLHHQHQVHQHDDSSIRLQDDDVLKEFNALWLDAHMQYCGAGFATHSEELDRAEEGTLDAICQKLHLQRDERLLDLSCGWGDLAIYAAEHYGVRVLGVTSSEQQAHDANLQIVRRGLGNRVSVKHGDYRSLGAGGFDKIAGVDIFGHIAVGHLTNYFARMYRLLKPGGLFLMQSVAHRPPAARAANGSVGACCASDSAGRELVLQRALRRWLLGQGRFGEHFFFSDGEPAAVSQANLAAERVGFEVREVNNLREHGASTLRQRVARLEAHHDQAASLSDQSYRTWRLLLAACAHNFDMGVMSVYQTLLRKPAATKSN